MLLNTDPVLRVIPSNLTTLFTSYSKSICNLFYIVLVRFFQLKFCDGFFNQKKKFKPSSMESTPFRTVTFFSKVKVSYRAMVRYETLK
jgi:hypothetical protein